MINDSALGQAELQAKLAKFCRDYGKFAQTFANYSGKRRKPSRKNLLNALATADFYLAGYYLSLTSLVKLKIQ
jgi:hypothetical protein